MTAEGRYGEIYIATLKRHSGFSPQGQQCSDSWRSKSMTSKCCSCDVGHSRQRYEGPLLDPVWPLSELPLKTIDRGRSWHRVVV